MNAAASQTARRSTSCRRRRSKRSRRRCQDQPILRRLPARPLSSSRIAPASGNGKAKTAWRCSRDCGGSDRAASILCAGAAQRDLVERGARELHFAREKLFGSAPEALAGAVRALVALETNGSPSDVALTILGVPPSQIVVPWEDAAIGGFAATRMLDEPARQAHRGSYRATVAARALLTRLGSGESRGICRRAIATNRVRIRGTRRHRRQAQSGRRAAGAAGP